MFRRLLPPVALSMCFLGGLSQQSGAESTVVQAGSVAILPCYFSKDDDLQYVEWSKTDLYPDYVVLYRDGKEEHGMKSEAFRYRTSLVRPEMDNEDKSLRIADVQLSDEGIYLCKSMRKSNYELRDVTAVRLSVVAVSMPELTLVESTNGTILQCEVRCSPCKLEMEFRGDGEVLQPDEPEFSLKKSGLFTRRLLFPNNISRVTCIVTQTKINLNLSQTLSVPAYCKASCALCDTTTTIIVTVCTVVAIIAIPAIIIIAIWKCCNSRDDPCLLKASLQQGASSVKSSPEINPLMDDMDGRGLHTPTGNGTPHQQQDTSPQPSPTGCHNPAYPSAASSSTTSAVSGSLQQQHFKNPHFQGGVLQSKSDHVLKKNTVKLKRCMSDSSTAFRPNNSKPYNHYNTVPNWGSLAGNRFAVLLEDTSDLLNGDE